VSEQERGYEEAPKWSTLALPKTYRSAPTCADAHSTPRHPSKECPSADSAFTRPPPRIAVRASRHRRRPRAPTSRDFRVRGLGLDLVCVRSGCVRGSGRRVGLAWRVAAGVALVVVGPAAGPRPCHWVGSSRAAGYDSFWWLSTGWAVVAWSLRNWGPGSRRGGEEAADSI
jgi:hypothetical protein